MPVIALLHDRNCCVVNRSVWLLCPTNVCSISEFLGWKRWRDEGGRSPQPIASCATQLQPTCATAALIQPVRGAGTSLVVIDQPSFTGLLLFSILSGPYHVPRKTSEVLELLQCRHFHDYCHHSIFHCQSFSYVAVFTD